jgi:hypothetical protein
VEGEGVAESTLEKGEGKGAELREPSVNKQQEGCQQAGDRPLTEVGKE